MSRLLRSVATAIAWLAAAYPWLWRACTPSGVLASLRSSAFCGACQSKICSGRACMFTSHI